MQRPTTTRHPATLGCFSGPGGEAAGRQRGLNSVQAFTLVELLVVIAIIGILAASSMPAIRSLMQSNTISAANRQILDDLAMARQSAISGRRTVYMVFVPQTLAQHKQQLEKQEAEPKRTRDLRQMTNLASGQFTAYALFTRRTVGDQPGVENPRYLTEWKQLPEGVFFAPNRYVDLDDAAWMARRTPCRKPTANWRTRSSRFPGRIVRWRRGCPTSPSTRRGRSPTIEA